MVSGLPRSRYSPLMNSIRKPQLGRALGGATRGQRQCARKLDHAALPLAMEGSARTIWILGQPDREVRRDRALNVLTEQLEQQKRFLKIEEDNANRGPNPPPPSIVAMNRAHQQKQTDLCGSCATTTQSPSPNRLGRQSLSRRNGSMRTCPIRHGRTRQLRSTRWYQGVGSSLVHGYKRALDYAWRETVRHDRR
jgi:hypothetical protein